MARNIQPATWLDPSDWANQPFIATPTPARASAAALSRIEAMFGRAASSGATVSGVAGAAGGAAMVCSLAASRNQAPVRAGGHFACASTSSMKLGAIRDSDEPGSSSDAAAFVLLLDLGL